MRRVGREGGEGIAKSVTIQESRQCQRQSDPPPACRMQQSAIGKREEEVALTFDEEMNGGCHSNSTAYNSTQQTMGQMYDEMGMIW